MKNTGTYPPSQGGFYPSRGKDDFVADANDDFTKPMLEPSSKGLSFEEVTEKDEIMQGVQREMNTLMDVLAALLAG